MVAGNETTRHTISHSMLALIENPDQMALLQEKPELIPVAVEEMLRWASPVYHFRRTATRDVELRGQQIKEGDKVVMWFASGNRDEEVFANPYSFDVTRHPNDHVTFGKGGPHFCLGNNLARLEIRLMFETLLPRLKSIELAGDVTRVRSQLRQRDQEVPGPRHHPLAERHRKSSRHSLKAGTPGVLSEGRQGPEVASWADRPA